MTEIEQLQASMRAEWYQTGLKTFFWAGVINAMFFAFGVSAMFRCDAMVEESERLKKINIALIDASVKWQAELDRQIDQANHKIRVLELLIRRQEEGSK